MAVACLVLGSTSVSAQLSLGYYKFKDGSEYTGELKGKKPHGKGRTVFRNGDVYEGEYVKENVKVRAPILSVTENVTWVSGSRTSSTVKVRITS